MPTGDFKRGFRPRKEGFALVNLRLPLETRIFALRNRVAANERNYCSRSARGISTFVSARRKKSNGATVDVLPRSTIDGAKTFFEPLERARANSLLSTLHVRREAHKFRNDRVCLRCFAAIGLPLLPYGRGATRKASESDGWSLRSESFQHSFLSNYII